MKTLVVKIIYRKKFRVYVRLRFVNLCGHVAHVFLAQLQSHHAVDHIFVFYIQEHWMSPKRIKCNADVYLHVFKWNVLTLNISNKYEYTSLKNYPKAWSSSSEVMDYCKYIIFAVKRGCLQHIIHRLNLMR